MSATSVLFDAPGPKARRRQRIAGAIGALIVAAFLGWFIYRLGVTDQFAGEKWSIFVDSKALRSLANALINTLIAAVLAIIGSLIFGAVFGALRVSPYGPLRWFATLIVEFFRAVPLVLLILFDVGAARP